MKRLYYLLLLLPFLSLAQTATGYEQQFDYGLQNLSPQAVMNPVYWGTVGSDGTMGKMPYFRPAYGDTGVLTFAGLTTNSSTTINIGAVTGWVQDNETTPSSPVSTYVNYAGATGVTVTTVGSGTSSYVMLSSAGVISFQNTFPTSSERKAKIWLGKVSHPAGAVTLVVNEPDYITSPMAFSRDWVQATGPYANNGVYPSANGANLNINISQGTITGDGINFVNDRAKPNTITMGPNTVASFMIRTQTGAGGGATTAITPGFYDVAGTITAIPGSSNQATIEYIWAVPGAGYIVQLGQTLYTNFGAAVAALGKETSFVVYPNLPGNAIPIAALVVTKGCTALNNTGVTAQFFPANKQGDFFGATAGFSTATLQSAYNNSLVPQIVTTSTLGPLTATSSGVWDAAAFENSGNGIGVRSKTTGNGWGSYTESQSTGIANFTTIGSTGDGVVSNGEPSGTGRIYVGKNNGVETFSVTKAGLLTGASLYSNGAVSATSANARGNYFTNALTATANSDNLTCLDLSPTFTNGAFTGVFNNLIKGAWNTSNFRIADLNAGSVMMYSVSSPSFTNYFSFATTTSYTLNAPSAAGNLSFALGGTSRARIMPSTGNLILQNGGTFTDVGYRLDVPVDNVRFGGSLTLSTAPTTSAGSYDIVTRNSSTGVIEKVLSSSLTDANALHKTGDESFTGIKSSINTGTSQINGFDLTNNGTSSARSVTLTNNASGLSLLCNNNSSGYGLYSANSGTGGTAVYGANTVNVGKAFSSNNQAGGYGYYSSNTGAGIGFYSSNEYTGHSIVSNGVSGSTGLVYVGQNNGTNTFTVDKLGNVAVNSISSNTTKITITTAVSITTATLDANSISQDGRHVVIDNGVNAINLTCNGGVTTSYGKIGSGAITFVQGSGRTLVQLSGTAVMNGIAGSKATIWSNGTTDYLEIFNY